MEDVVISATMEDLVITFAEWDKRYRENPDQFWSDVEHLLGNTPKTYGEAAAAYFAHVFQETTICVPPAPVI